MPDTLKVESEALAASLGISMTALMAVALRDYLDRPVTPWSGKPSIAVPLPVSVAPRGSGSVVPAVALRVATVYAVPASRSDSCPCGKTDPSGSHRVKWKHCHGKAV